MSRLWAVFPVSLGKRWVILNSYRSARRVSWDPERPHLPCVPRALLGPPSPGGFSSAATPPHPAQCSPSRLGVTRWEGSQAPGCHLAGRIPPEDSAAPGPAPCVFCFRETHAGHPLTCSWVQMPRCILGGARAERRGQRGRLGSMQTQLPSREVGLQPSSLNTRHPPKGKRPSCRRSGVNPSKGKQMVRPPQKELGTCPSLIFLLPNNEKCPVVPPIPVCNPFCVHSNHCYSSQQ